MFPYLYVIKSITNSVDKTGHHKVHYSSGIEKLGTYNFARIPLETIRHSLTKSCHLRHFAISSSLLPQSTSLASFLARSRGRLRLAHQHSADPDMDTALQHGYMGEIRGIGIRKQNKRADTDPDPRTILKINRNRLLQL